MTAEKRRPASFCYVEIPAPDVERSAAFYRTVFGWTVEPSHLTDFSYWTFEAGERGLSGGLDSRLEAEDGGVLLYLRVEDIAATLEAVRRAGGSVVGEKREVGGEHGYFALFQDPCGNRLGLWSRT